MEPTYSSPSPSEAVILLVSGTCCVPQMAVLDQQAQQIIHQALEETGVRAQVRTLTISSALNGGIPPEVLKAIGVPIDASNIMRLPAVLINNRLVSFGVPQLDAMKNALRSVQK